MTVSLSRALVVATVIALGAAACAGNPPQWTFAPVPSPEASAEPTASGQPGGSPTPAETGAPAGTPAPAESAAPGESAGPTDEARVVEIQATSSLQFTTADGERITDIPVTPGETVLFRVDNVAGFDHNFQIGADEELSVPNAPGLPGIPTWTSGVQEFEWAVPDDVTGLKFGCTIPGHYATMQGTFSAAS